MLTKYQSEHVVVSDGGVVAYKVDCGRHSAYAVEDNGVLVCYTVYKKGAVALVEYINKIKGSVK